jgi:hypothetical protein
MGDTFMLWFSNDTKIPLSARVEKAVLYYKEKYGIDATICRLHPNMFKQITSDEKPIIELRPDRSVAMGHFLIGDE